MDPFAFSTGTTNPETFPTDELAEAVARPAGLMVSPRTPAGREPPRDIGCFRAGRLGRLVH